MPAGLEENEDDHKFSNEQKGYGGERDMGKNKNKGISSDPMKQKTQELEDTKRISRGFHKNNPTKPK